MTEIPNQPWQTIAMDFGGPYPDGHYNLVVIDKQSRYPEVEQINSTAAKPTINKLRKIMATYGIPRRLESDGGPPFQSKEFAEFAEEMGFQHHVVTPEHARANGEVEAFMKMVNKTEQIAKLQGKNTKTAMIEMLMGYRSTPHPATKVSPYKALMNREIRTKIDSADPVQEDDIKDHMEEHDKKYKVKIKDRAEKCNVKEHTFIMGDYVLLKQSKKNKWSTAYEPAFYIVVGVHGSSIKARRVMDGREVTRDASKFKLANMIAYEKLEEEEPPPAEDLDEDWREELFRTAGDKPMEDQPSQSTMSEATDAAPTSLKTTEVNHAASEQLHGSRQIRIE